MTTAKTRKRCPDCGRMIEIGERVTITDDRSQQHGAGKTPWIGHRQSYPRGAFHLWHPTCRTALLARLDELRVRADAELETLRREIGLHA